MAFGGVRSEKLLQDRILRAADVLLAVVALPLAIPAMLLLALVVLLAMGRPIFFIQERAGMSGRVFRIRKFRTMTSATDSSGESLPDEQRLTKFGRLLRRSRFDELPQLWNILVGDMSLIGPRPLLPATIAAMGDEGRERSSVRPGLTGWAQISGNSSLDGEAKIALDLWYIRNRSLKLDLVILVQTVTLVLFGEKISTERLTEAQAARIEG